MALAVLVTVVLLLVLLSLIVLLERVLVVVSMVCLVTDADSAATLVAESEFCLNEFPAVLCC